MDSTHLLAFLIGAAVCSLAGECSQIVRLLWQHLLRLFNKFQSFRRSFAAYTAIYGTKAQLLTRAQVEQNYPPQTWQRQAYESYASKLIAKDRKFPCIYASKGHIANEQLYIFISSEDPSEPRNVQTIGWALRSYFPQSRQLGPNTSLVILSPPPPEHLSAEHRSAEDYHLLYWALLKGLTRIDQKPWPKDIPEETDRLRWCFCFDGVPAFSAVLTPAHHQRHSRYAPNLCIVFQPKWVFDILFSTRQKQEAAVNGVRALVREYDDVALSPDLKSYGDEGSRECRQYFLLDDNKSALCPYEKLTI